LKQITGSNNHQSQLVSLLDDDQRVNKQTSSILEEIHKKGKLEVKERQLEN
jgi:hypothetical protein